ncbi:MAG: NIPSNAP family protein [Saprospiraceae bacterium]
MRPISPVFTVLSIACFSLAGCSGPKNLPRTTASPNDYYELRTYHLQNTIQEQNVDHYLQQAFLPALHRAGWTNIGVFKPVETDTANFGKMVFVLIPAHSLEALAALPQTLQHDPQYAAAAPDYQFADNDHPPYQRLEISWLAAFSGHPQLEVPNITTPRSERVYELRSYESATEKLHINKVRMFNAGDEIGLFKKLDFHAVFYSSALAGAHLPNLVYMIGFDNAAARDEHWNAFRASPEWKTLTGLPEYQAKNVSHIDSYLLHPTNYSDF